MTRILWLGLLSCCLSISLSAAAQEESVTEVSASNEASKQVETTPVVRTEIIETSDSEVSNSITTQQLNTAEKVDGIEESKNVKDKKALAPPVSPLASSGKVVLALIFIIFLIFILAYILRRYQQFTPFNSSRSQPLINILSTQPLGVKEKIALIEVGEKQVLVGVTQQSIQSLMVLEGDQRVASSKSVQDDSNTPTDKNIDGFQDVLRRALMK